MRVGEAAAAMLAEPELAGAQRDRAGADDDYLLAAAVRGSELGDERFEPGPPRLAVVAYQQRGADLDHQPGASVGVGEIGERGDRHGRRA